MYSLICYDNIKENIFNDFNVYYQIRYIIFNHEINISYQKKVFYFMMRLI